jgi:microcystin-dependent protein
MEPFIGEIRIAAFGIAPKGWALCNGQLLSINQNQALFSILGTTYGGDGRTNFALPDLRGRVPVHFDGTLSLGSKAGEEAHRLTQTEMPTHQHVVSGTSAPADTGSPTGNFWASGSGQSPFASSGNTGMAPNAVAPAGGPQPHENMSPYLTVNFIIALVGIYPSRD